jgi:hypothetical protein
VFIQVSAIQTGRKKEARKASHMRCLREYVVDIVVECGVSVWVE